VKIETFGLAGLGFTINYHLATIGRLLRNRPTNEMYIHVFQAPKSFLNFAEMRKFSQIELAFYCQNYADT
jgi:hypothetical protein